MKYWATLAQTIDSVSRSVGNAVAYAAIAMALVTTTVVILRYGFGQGAIAAQESVLYLHGALFMLGAAPTLLADKHVRVDVFYRNFTDRQKHWVNTIGHTMFTLPFCTLILLGLGAMCQKAGRSWNPHLSREAYQRYSFLKH